MQKKKKLKKFNKKLRKYFENVVVKKMNILGKVNAA